MSSNPPQKSPYVCISENRAVAGVNVNTDDIDITLIRTQLSSLQLSCGSGMNASIAFVLTTSETAPHAVAEILGAPLYMYPAAAELYQFIS